MKKLLVIIAIIALLIFVGCEKDVKNDGLLSLAKEKIYTIKGEDGYLALPGDYEKLKEKDLIDEMEKSINEIIEKKQSGEEIIWEVKAVTKIAEFFPELFEKIKDSGQLGEGNIQMTPPNKNN